MLVDSARSADFIGRGRRIRARSGNTSDRVYVHAKVGIVDDRWLTLGSANLNAHSFFNDSEVNVVTCDAALARDTRLRLWAPHLERDIDEVAGDPNTVVDELWRPTAAEQRERRNRGAPLTHGLVELEATSRRSKRLLGPLQALLVDGERQRGRVADTGVSVAASGTIGRAYEAARDQIFRKRASTIE